MPNEIRTNTQLQQSTKLLPNNFNLDNDEVPTRHLENPEGWIQICCGGGNCNHVSSRGHLWSFSAKALDCDLILHSDNAVARDWNVEVSRTRSLSSPSRHPAKGHVYRTRPTQHHGGWGAAQNMKSSSTSINPRR